MLFNLLGVEVLRPNQKLIILRGVPGSGKSTKAKEIVENGIIHSTDEVISRYYNYDEYWENLFESDNIGLHTKMHKINLRDAKKSMYDGVSPVIIDNLNLHPNEPKGYVKFALELGFANDNIEIINIPTDGLTAEILAKRNLHGVSADRIDRLLNRYRTFKDITIKDIMESKDKISYSSVNLDTESKDKIISIVGEVIPDGWEIINHHMTIKLGQLPSDLKEDLGKQVTLKVETIGYSEMAMALGVSGYFTKNEIAHVTVAINKEEGAKPVMSNDIENWGELREPFEITGVVTENI